MAGRPGLGTGTAGTPAGSGPAAPGGLRAIRHVWVIELANQGYAQSFGTPSADPYLARTLPQMGALLSHENTAEQNMDQLRRMWSGQPRTPGTARVCCGRCTRSRWSSASSTSSTATAAVGRLDGDYHDPRCAWHRHRQSASDGAIVVRPDRFIAWRYPAAANDHRAVLTAALSQILGRRSFAQPGSAGS